MRNLRLKNCRLFFLFSLVALILAVIPAYGSDWVFTASTPGGHRGAITAIAHKGDVILSAGEDGFLEIWNTKNAGAAERFQLSPYRIMAMAERPGTDEVCILESDGMVYRISVWNFKERKNIFSQVLSDPVGSVFYSTGGDFIIAAKTGRTGLVFLDSVSGNTLQSPQTLTGTVSLAATGRSGRNMVVYLASGKLSYWELESGREITQFNAPQNLHSPVLFSNSRFFAGVNADGLSVIDAVSGDLLAKDSTIPADSLLCSAGDELVCLVQKGTARASAELSRYTIDRSGKMNKTGSFTLTASGGGDNRFTSIATDATGTNGSGSNRRTIALGTSDGSLVLAGMNGQPKTLSVKEQVYITEAEVSGSTIAFLTDRGTLGFIPLDYNQLTGRRTIQIEQNQTHTRITAFADVSGQFVFWQDKDTKTQPVIRSTDPGSKKIIDGITFRSPISAADSFGGKILFLDSMGNLSVVSPLNGKKPFNFFSAGLMDAALIDQDRLIIGRSAVSGNTPFMIININTGETVPLPYPAQAGVIVRRGAAGKGGIYAAAVSAANNGDAIRTFVLQLDLTNIAHSAKFVDFPGEDTSFSLVPLYQGDAVDIAATIGGEGATIYSGGSFDYKLDRSGGFPLKLMDGGSALISLDRDGSICWHDRSGKLLAVFRLHPDGWTLQTERGTMSGSISR